MLVRKIIKLDLLKYFFYLGSSFSANPSKITKNLLKTCILRIWIFAMLVFGLVSISILDVSSAVLTWSTPNQ
jgi:hypothetical protein